MRKPRRTTHGRLFVLVFCLMQAAFGAPGQSGSTNSIDMDVINLVEGVNLQNVEERMRPFLERIASCKNDEEKGGLYAFLIPALTSRIGDPSFQKRVIALADEALRLNIAQRDRVRINMYLGQAYQHAMRGINGFTEEGRLPKRKIMRAGLQTVQEMLRFQDQFKEQHPGFDVNNPPPYVGGRNGRKTKGFETYQAWLRAESEYKDVTSALQMMDRVKSNAVACAAIPPLDLEGFRELAFEILEDKQLAQSLVLEAEKRVNTARNMMAASAAREEVAAVSEKIVDNAKVEPTYSRGLATPAVAKAQNATSPVPPTATAPPNRMKWVLLALLGLALALTGVIVARRKRGA
jgi:hypothetical protein